MAESNYSLDMESYLRHVVSNHLRSVSHENCRGNYKACILRLQLANCFVKRNFQRYCRHVMGCCGGEQCVERMRLHERCVAARRRRSAILAQCCVGRTIAEEIVLVSNWDRIVV